jgi:hypothetical protein
VWIRGGTAIYYRYGAILSDGLHLTGSNTNLYGINNIPKNPAIAASKIPGSSEIAHLVWEENGAIKYYTFNSTPPGTIQTISTGSLPYNYSP